MGRKAEEEWPLATKENLAWAFLQHCFAVDRAFLTDRSLEGVLRAEVYPLYQTLPRCENFSRRLADRVLEHFDNTAGEYPEKEFAQALLEWATEFNLKFKGVVVPAILALATLETPVWEIVQFQQSAVWDRPSDDDGVLHFESSWNPQKELEDDAKTRIMNEVACAVLDYFEHRKRWARKSGLPPPKKQRASKLGTPDDRLYWVALYAVANYTYEDIAEVICEDTGIDAVDAKDVGKIIRKIAASLELALPERRGKKSKKAKK